MVLVSFLGIDVDTPTGGVYIGDSPTDWSAAFPDDGAAALEVQEQYERRANARVVERATARFRSTRVRNALLAASRVGDYR